MCVVKCTLCSKKGVGKAKSHFETSIDIVFSFYLVFSNREVAFSSGLLLVYGKDNKNQGDRSGLKCLQSSAHCSQSDFHPHEG